MAIKGDLNKLKILDQIFNIDLDFDTSNNHPNRATSQNIVQIHEPHREKICLRDVETRKAQIVGTAVFLKIGI